MQTLRDIGNGEWGELVVGSRALSLVLHSNLYIPSTTKTQKIFKFLKSDKNGSFYILSMYTF